MRAQEEAALRQQIASAQNSSRVRVEALEAERDDLLVQVAALQAQADAHDARISAMENGVAALKQQVAAITPPGPPTTTPPTPNPTTPGTPAAGQVT
jgi:outer membrane protein TolC